MKRMQASFRVCVAFHWRKIRGMHGTSCRFGWMHLHVCRRVWMMALWLAFEGGWSGVWRILMEVLFYSNISALCM